MALLRRLDNSGPGGLGKAGHGWLLLPEIPDHVSENLLSHGINHLANPHTSECRQRQG